MTGGELQLATYGAEDIFLTGNPQISFFKKIYRRYTNFSMESIELDFEGNTKLSLDSNLELRCKILKYGDLVSNMYFTFTLPDIYAYDPMTYYMNWAADTTPTSTLYKNGGVGNITADNGGAAEAKQRFDARRQNYSAPYFFEWIDNIGTNMIDNVRISIGGVMIDKHYGEWLTIWNELQNGIERIYEREYIHSLSTNDAYYRIPHNIYNRLVGNINELKRPWKGNDATGYLYPTSFAVTRQDGTTLEYPSIQSRKIYVPLIFWFNKNPGLALPLIALPEQDVYIHIEIRQLLDLYTMVREEEYTEADLESFQRDPHRPWSGHQPVWRKTKPDKGRTMENIGSCLRPSGSVTHIDIDPHLEVNYIFLSQEERLRYMNMDFEYLIETTKRFKSESHHLKTINMLLELSNPVKNLVWVAKRDDLEETNQYNNYTNWVSPWANPYRTDRGNATKGSIDASYEYITRTNGEEYFPTTAQLAAYSDAFFKKEIITNTKITFNGVIRVNKTSDFFQYVQTYQTFQKELALDGLYLYSFEINNNQYNQYKQDNQYQPAGACNMGKINKIEVEFEINVPPVKTTVNTTADVGTNYWYRYDIYVYATSYNVLKISGGMAQLEYTS